MINKARKSDRDYLNALLDSTESLVYKAFISAIQSIKQDKVVKQIVALLQSGRIEEAIKLVERYAKVFAGVVTDAHVSAGSSTAASISGMLGITVAFDSINARAVRTMQESQLRLIREIAEDQRAAVREVLTDGIMRGVNPRQQAIELRRSIGLTMRQIQAINRYRKMLENSSLQALDRELRDRRFDLSVRRGALSLAQINRMVDRYAERQLRFRAETIARTEALRVVHQANHEAFLQAVESGDVSSNRLTREWVAAKDERTRGSHAAMDGQKRSLSEDFISGAGYRLRYPGDLNAPASEVVNCRCIVTTTLTKEN